MRDLDVWAVSDAMAAQRPELHEASLANMDYGFASVFTADEVLTKIK